MVGALLTSLFFAGTAVCANRSARLLGSARANLWRLLVAAGVLGTWATVWGRGLGGGALPLFFVSGVIGFGIGGVAMFYALPMIGSNLAMLIVQCGSAVFAATVEWLWLGTTLSALQIAFSLVILTGVGIGLRSQAARHRAEAIPVRQLAVGIGWAVLSAFGQGFSAVVSRKAFFMLKQSHVLLDPGTSAYQRVLGGLAVGLVTVLVLLVFRALGKKVAGLRGEGSLREATPWIGLNALLGPILGVTCYQWALRTTPAGIVLPLVATAPLLTLPLAWLMEGSRPTKSYYIAAFFAVLGTIGLQVWK